MIQQRTTNGTKTENQSFNGMSIFCSNTKRCSIFMMDAMNVSIHEGCMHQAMHVIMIKVFQNEKEHKLKDDLVPEMYKSVKVALIKAKDDLTMKEKVLISSSQVVLLQDGRRRSVGFQIADDNKALVWCISNSLVLNFFYAMWYTSASCIQHTQTLVMTYRLQLVLSQLWNLVS